jgi:L-threonylcarbamoyladenylate synthase
MSKKNELNVNTLILHPGTGEALSEMIEKAAALLRSGETVAFPTETVYGLGANALDPAAIKKIFAAKGRPSDNPLIVHIADFEDLEALVEEVSVMAKDLMNAFWPGPLTLVMKKKPEVPFEVTAGLPTVAVRMPVHVLARRLIRAAGVPVAAPSANLSGRPSPTSAEDVIRDLDRRVACIVCGDTSEIGLESTVVDVTGKEPVILRPGGITLEMIREVAGSGRYDEAVDRKLLEGEQASSPGMKYAHYSPDAEVLIFTGLQENVRSAVKARYETLKSCDKVVGVMTFDEHLEDYAGLDHVMSLGHLSKLEEVGQNLFRTLRAFDDAGVEVILSEGVEDTGFGKAIMNRLIKAAGYRIIGT